MTIKNEDLKEGCFIHIPPIRKINSSVYKVIMIGWLHKFETDKGTLSVKLKSMTSISERARWYNMESILQGPWIKISDEVALAKIDRWNSNQAMIIGG